MNQFEMYEKLNDSINKLIESSEELKSNSADFKPYVIDNNSFMYLLSEFYDNTNDKGRLISIVKNWGAKLLFSIKYEGEQWTQLNKELKKYEIDGYLFIEYMNNTKIDQSAYFKYYILLLALYFELERFIILKDSQETVNNEALPIKKEIPTKKEIGKSNLTQPQFCLLVYYLRNKSIISPNIESKELGKYFSMLTAFSENSLSKTIVKNSSEPFKITGKESDFSTLIRHLEDLTSSIKRDKNKFKDDGELK